MIVDIPDNIEKWIEKHDGVNLSVNVNPASTDYGYAHIKHLTVTISMLTRTCHHCGYDQIWNPDDSESKCRRHTYGIWRYDPVFEWTSNDGWTTLKTAFDVWLSKQTHDNGWNPIVKMRFRKSEMIRH